LSKWRTKDADEFIVAVLDKVKVHSQAECERADVVVCLRANAGGTRFPDDVHAQCSRCGSEITHRPHVPAAPKICVECWADTLADNSEFVISPKIKAELLAWLRRH
jgi:hypothetical protein